MVETSTTCSVESTSCQDGHTTFFSSAYDSLKNLTNFIITSHQSETKTISETITTKATYSKIQAKKDSNPQHSVLETDTLPLELLAYFTATERILSVSALLT